MGDSFASDTHKDKTDSEIMAEAKIKDRMLNRRIINRFGKRLLEKMNGYVMNFDGTTNYPRKILESLIYPEECYVPDEEEKALLSLADGPTPAKLYHNILTEKLDCLPYPSPREIKFRFELRQFVKCIEDSYRDDCKDKCITVLEDYKEKIRAEREDMLKKVKKKYNDRVVRRKVLHTLKLFDIRFNVIKEEIFKMLEKRRKLFEPERSNYLKEYENLLTSFRDYKIKLDADLDLMENKAKAEKIGKDTINLILNTIYVVPYQQILRMTKKIREGIPAKENCGYNCFLDSNRWWNDIVQSELRELHRICEEMKDDELEVQALNSVLKENIVKYFAWSEIIRLILREFHISMSVIFEEDARYVQYLPIFEKYFKMRMSWYIANVNKDLPEDIRVLRKLDNKLIKAAIDETCSEEIAVQKRLKKRKQPLSVTFKKMEEDESKSGVVIEEVTTDSKEKEEEQEEEEENFCCYVNTVIGGMKKEPHIWSYYVGHY